MKHAIDLKKVNALKELERLGWVTKHLGNDEILCKCPNPSHTDTNPSVCLNISNLLWHCKVPDCGKKGDFVTFLALAVGQERGVVLADLRQRYPGLDVAVNIPQDKVERFHKRLYKEQLAEPLLQSLYMRGVTDDMIRKARIGFDRGRITIPIYDEHRRCVNVRRYLPGAPGPEKFRNTPGHGRAVLYQPEQLEHERVMICGGEMKALVAAEYLNQYGIGTVAPSAGEGSWHSSWTPLLRGKDVLVCMDVDHAGRQAAMQVASQIRSCAKSVRIVALPLDPSQYPKGDLNDYVGHEQATPEQLLEVVEAAPTYEPTGLSSDIPVSDPKSVNISDFMAGECFGKYLQFEGVVNSLAETPFLIPKKVNVTCDRKQPNCYKCPIMAEDPAEDVASMEILKHTEGVLHLCGTDKSKRKAGVMEALGVPTCKSFEFEVVEQQTAQHCFVREETQFGAEESCSNRLQESYVVYEDLELNTPYRFTGVLHAHPANSLLNCVIDSVTLTDSNLNNFDPKEGDLQSLQVFQPDDWSVSALRQKLDHIYTDMAANVTHIHQRPELHLVVDLTYFSPLWLELGGQQVKGWVNSLIIGDSSQGKTETSLRLQQHYHLGHRLDCKSATFAGLVAGLQQRGKTWFFEWGALPTHDRRLVILEEFKGLSPDIIGKLTEIRSSGRAQVTKIQTHEAQARTRQILVSNPRGRLRMALYSYGIEAVLELLGKPEDVRRLDIVVGVRSDEIDLDHRETRRVEHTYTSKLSNRLVLYAWSRRQDQINFDTGVEELIYSEATRLSKVYSQEMMLVDAGGFKHKLARLAASLAIRTFSITDDLETILVRRCHVEMIITLLRQLYDGSVLDYLAFSEARNRLTTVDNWDMVTKQLHSVPYPRPFAEQLLHSSDITLHDISAWTGYDRETANGVLSLFLRHCCLYKHKRTYCKNAEFTQFLHEHLQNGAFIERKEDEI